jgi:DNA-binding helix-hairpin-helix protein with protein kinase domain
MLALEECRNAPFLAWPLMPVFDTGNNIIGFVMRKTSGRTLRALYAPSQVKRFFPGWNRLSVTQVALNLVNAVQMLARHRVLVNDFNPDNFLIDQFGQVRLIDCDSFQIPVENGTPFMTRTFTPEFAAPELLLHPELFNQPRTPEQVRFSLAVVIYMLLMSGLHPYARCGGGDPAENLKSGKCPLDKNSGVRMPVSWYKSVSWLTPGLKDCFLRMFTDGFWNPSKRPLLGELRNELSIFIEAMKKSKNENQRAILPKTAKRGK